ncbi:MULTISPECIES: hypothetical protein [unclassified Sphingomonas]|uniref:hypothetical protein n=1 Tax=unclassified Sphingomonas TaxID=196159 RepID=UPI0006F835B9|nr:MULTISPECIES: hypothetical protein [unclassified Sphingomonas]KRB89546.1 hypothetical protein ASE22_17950 [Sphingomonas sp. Root720]
MKKLAALMIFLLGLAGCGDWTMMKASLSNRARKPINAISVDFAGKIKRIDELFPGHETAVMVFSGREGGICLTYWQGGTRRQYALGYLTRNMPVHYRIAIRDRDISILDDSVGGSSRRTEIARPLPPGKECASHG